MYAWVARQDLDLSGLESRVFDRFVKMLIMVTQMHEFICIAFFLISTCLRNILIILGANCNWYRFSVLMNFIPTILILAVVGLSWSLLRGKEGVKFLLSSHPVPRDNWLTTTPNPGNNWQNWCHYQGCPQLGTVGGAPKSLAEPLKWLFLCFCYKFQQ